MLSYFIAEEPHGLAQLVHSVLAIFDGDPTVEPCIAERLEDRIIVVQALADHSVFEVLGIAERAILPLQIFQRSADEMPIRSVHCDDSVFDGGKETERILARDDRVRGIEVDAEPRRIDLVDDLQKHFRALCNPGIAKSYPCNGSPSLAQRRARLRAPTAP